MLFRERVHRLTVYTLFEGTSAIELATAPWVVDGVTLPEALFAIGPLYSMSGSTDVEHSSPELARRIMSLISYPPKDIDLYLVSKLQTMRWLNLEGFERLLAEPWFVDGLDEEERIYLIAVTGAEQLDQLFEPYTMASTTIALPHTGDVKLWAVRHGPFYPGQDILAKMEEAVRGNERFWKLPFPVNHVTLYLVDDPGYRRVNIGNTMVLGTEGGNLSHETVYHEVAHYYFNEGPSWFKEGGAVFMNLYLSHDGNIPTLEFPEHCAEEGFDNLQALNDVGGGSAWDSCRYPMGLHFLVALRETIGKEAWLSALRAFYLEFGLEGLFVSTSRSPADEDVYQVFMENTPPELVDEVRDVFRRLHGGPFIDTED